MPSDKKYSVAYPAVLRSFLLLSCAVISIINAYYLLQEIRAIHKIKKIVPFSFAGLKFAGLEPFLKDARIVGYYTDKNIEENEPAKQFAQAQLILAPIILDLNNVDHAYILFDCSSEKAAFEKIKEIGAQPLKKNQFGIILAKRIL